MIHERGKNRITILMSIYNCASTLEKALDSLMGQSYQNFKVVLCDDCSTDNTYKVAKEYTDKFPDKFILLRNDENMRLAYSLNRCLEYADTEYVARMDGDDISKPERLKKEIEFLDSHPEFAIVSCAMEYSDGNKIFMVSKPISEPTKKDFIGNVPHAHAPVMIRTDAIKNVKGYTVKKWTRRSQDSHLWAKLYSQGYRGYNFQEPLYVMLDDNKARKRRKTSDALLSFRRRYEIYKLLGINYIYLYHQIIDLGKTFLPNSIYNFFHTRKQIKKS